MPATSERSFVLSFSLLLSLAGSAVAQESETADAANDAEQNPASVLTSEQWVAVDGAVDRALKFLAARQQADGSFAGPQICQPAVTSLSVMAFLSRGHLPGQGEYGRQLDKALDFVLSTQRESGLFSASVAEPYLPAQPSPWDDARAHALYNHAITGLMLTEVYGMVDQKRGAQVRKAVVDALAFSREHQIEHKKLKRDYGGWRYMFHNNGMDADLSVTSWQLKFYRSAKNAEFDVPKQYVDDALGFVKSCFDPDRDRFRYSHVPNDYRYTRAMSGAGIISLAMGGEHGTEMATTAARSLLKDSFEYNRPSPYNFDRYHYSVYFCTIAMYQMGGDYWSEFYPPMVEILLANQRQDGSWDEESADARFGKSFGNTYTTAMMVMVLTLPNQLLPIYQR